MGDNPEISKMLIHSQAMAIARLDKRVKDLEEILIDEHGCWRCSKCMEIRRKCEAIESGDDICTFCVCCS